MARKRKPTHVLYQFKITLIEAKPAIWRRIQVKDCTLDTLHEHIRDDKERVGTLEWADGWFDPDEFDPITATKSLRKGLPDWRSMG